MKFFLSVLVGFFGAASYLVLISTLQEIAYHCEIPDSAIEKSIAGSLSFGTLLCMFFLFSKNNLD